VDILGNIVQDNDVDEPVTVDQLGQRRLQHEQVVRVIPGVGIAAIVRDVPGDLYLIVFVVRRRVLGFPSPNKFGGQGGRGRGRVGLRHPIIPAATRNDTKNAA
jgi:hypothetical protein